MTGRELIIYIMNNHLEDVEMFGPNGSVLGLIDETALAAKFNVGVETIKLWYQMQLVAGIRIGDRLYFLRGTKDPRHK